MTHSKLKQTLIDCSYAGYASSKRLECVHYKVISSLVTTWLDYLKISLSSWKSVGLFFSKSYCFRNSVLLAFSFLVNASHHDLSWRNRLLHHFSARTPSAFIRLSHNSLWIISTIAFLNRVGNLSDYQNEKKRSSNMNFIFQVLNMEKS